MTIDIYRDPVKMVDVVFELGLRHVSYGIPRELFGLFVSACVAGSCDHQGRNHHRYLSLVLGDRLGMLVRTITEGSTTAMKAINVSPMPKLRRAIHCAPGEKRATWMVQVGTQRMSPLA